MVALEDMYLVLHNVHEERCHPGRDKTMQVVKEEMGIANISREIVVMHMSFCHGCQAKKGVV
jgi:hypothetical protein